MSFDAPAAFWGLFSLALLILFSLWRQAAVRVTVPSVSLWKKIPERNPPIRALRRPRWRMELLLQALAVAAVVAALAAPFLRSDRPVPRRIALVFDSSARFRAGGRLEKMRAEARALLEGALKDDDVALFSALPSPRRLESLSELRLVDAHVDLAALVAAARATADEVVVFSDRPVEDARVRLLGGPAGNLGIVGFTAADREMFVRIANHGAARRVRLTLEAGVRIEEDLDVPVGISTWSRKGDYSGVPAASVTLAAGDGFPLDDSVRASRLSSTRSVVTFTGRPSPEIRRAFQAIPGVEIGGEGGEAQISVGVDAVPGPAALKVFLYPLREGGPLRGVRVHPHALTRGLEPYAKELDSVGVGALPGRASGGVPLVTAGGKTAMAWRKGELHFAVDPDPERWPAGPRSFPIFWTNVVDFARKGAAGFVTVRTGRATPLPDDVESVTPVDGGTSTFSAGGGFLAWTVGSYDVKRPGGAGTIRANLLDPRETDAAGTERPLDWDPAAPEGREPMKRPLGAWAAAAALALLAAAWMLERRPE